MVELLNSITEFVPKLLKSIVKNYKIVSNFCDNIAVLMVFRKSHVRLHLLGNAAPLSGSDNRKVETNS